MKRRLKYDTFSPPHRIIFAVQATGAEAESGAIPAFAKRQSCVLSKFLGPEQGQERLLLGTDA